MTSGLPITDQLLEPLDLSPNDVMTLSLHGKSTDEFELTLGDRRDSDTYRGFPSSAARREFPSRFPEIREIAGWSDTRWITPTTDVSASLIRHLWPSSQLRMTPDARVVFAYLVSTLEQQTTAVRRSAEYHARSYYRKVVQQLAIPTQPPAPSYDLGNGASPMLHQRVALANSAGSEGFGLFMEQGTGKTAVVIGRVDKEAAAHSGRLYRTIIVAPKNVRSNWESEFKKFSTVKGKVTVLRGGAFERVKLLLEAMTPDDDEQRYTVVVCSYQTLWGSWDVLGKIEWDLAVLDESHYIKWPRTKQAQYALKLRDVSRQRMCLTGTPICNTPIDLYAQLEFLRQGGSGFRSFEKFRKFYGVYASVDSERGVKRLVDVQNLPFMRERIARLAFVVRKEEALPDLPDKVYDVVEVEMSPAQREAYDTIRSHLFLEIKSELDQSERTVNANNILTRLLRLSQVTSGFITFDPITDLDTGEQLVPKTIDRFDPNPKIEALIDLLKDPEKESTEKTIVWACWVQDIKTISARLTAEGIDHVTFMGSTKDADRRLAEERFNGDPACRVFVGNPACGGTGLNLIGYPPGDESYDTDCTHVIYFSQDWSNPKRSQSEDRAHRRGTRRNVRITDLCVPQTIDEEIRARVTNKRLVALEVQDLREVLQRVLGKVM